MPPVQETSMIAVIGIMLLTATIAFLAVRLHRAAFSFGGFDGKAVSLSRDAHQKKLQSQKGLTRTKASSSREKFSAPKSAAPASGISGRARKIAPGTRTRTLAPTGSRSPIRTPWGW